LRLTLFPRKLERSDLQILVDRFPYYSRMNKKFKKDFEKRLQYILSSRQFYSRGGLQEVTEEMEVLIGATITMVIFGWKKVRLPHFRKILIYPNQYYSSINRAYHEGEVNPNFGIIVLSWRAFLEGLSDEGDGINLGVHEVAHALKLENQIKRNNEFNFISPRLLQEYRGYMANEIKLMESGKESPFRENALINEDEFFAVVLENFFERPEIFSKKRPEFYKVMTLLMQQDPLVVSPKIALVKT